MKEKDSDILKRVARNDGMTVPPGFFEDFAARMSASLPENAEAEGTAIVIPRRTVWQRIRPYAYMAAMFAGVWCMFKMFSMMSGSGVDLSIENNQVLTEALSDDSFVFDHFMDDINEDEIWDDMYNDSITVDDFLPAEELDAVGADAPDPVVEAARAAQ